MGVRLGSNLEHAFKKYEKWHTFGLNTAPYLEIWPAVIALFSNYVSTHTYANTYIYLNVRKNIDTRVVLPDRLQSWQYVNTVLRMDSIGGLDTRRIRGV